MHAGAIAEVPDEDSAYGHRDALVEFSSGSEWFDPAEDAEQIAASRAYAAGLEPFASGAYVNTLTDETVRRAYPPAKYQRLVALKRQYDPHNVFHLNQNIPPSGRSGAG